VKSIASLHGGSVTLTSKEGSGTRVALWFPVDGLGDPARDRDEATSEMTRS
jgi:signal transduction histidine kinase